MGWCHEFGLHITARCDHPMIAGRSSCSCEICGTECLGKFEKDCEDVWDRSLRRPTALANLGIADKPSVGLDLEWTPSGPAEDAPSATVLQMRPAEEAPTLPGIALVDAAPPTPLSSERRPEPAPPPGVSPLFPVEPVPSAHHPASVPPLDRESTAELAFELATALAPELAVELGAKLATELATKLRAELAAELATTLAAELVDQVASRVGAQVEALGEALAAQDDAVAELRAEMTALAARPQPPGLDADALAETLKSAMGTTVTENRRISQQIDLAQRRVAELAETLPDRTADATAALVASLAQRVEAAAGGVEAVGRIRHVLSELSARMGQLQGEVTRLAMAQEAIAARLDSDDRGR